MRTIILLLITSVFFIALPTTASSQTSTAELEKNIRQATEAIKAQNFVEAYRELEKAKSETQKLVSAQLEKIFPETAGGWVVKKPLTTVAPGIPPLGLPAGQGNLSITKNYERAKEKQDTTTQMPGMYMEPNVLVSVSADTFPASNIIMIHSNKSTVPPIGGEEVKAIFIKNYKAVTRVNSAMKMASISILAGKGVVLLHGMQVDSLESLMKLAEAIDLKKVEEVFGK